MRIHMIVNPHAGSANQLSQLLQAVKLRSDVTVYEIGPSDEIADVVDTALQAGAELLLAGGGDGTVHNVLNALAPAFDQVKLGIIPLGTGNDLARTLSLALDPMAAFASLEQSQERVLDVIEMAYGEHVKYGLNMAVGGFTGQMNEVLNEELKASWGPLAYLIGAVQVLPELIHYDTDVCWDDGTTDTLPLLNLVIANGRTAGGGWAVAPMANPEDGVLDVIGVCYTSFMNLAEMTAQFIAGTYLANEHVLYRRAQQVTVTSTPGMWFNLDGELLTNEPVKLTIRPRTLRIVVGCDYAPDGITGLSTDSI
jgi:diacylglycerol kinase (ATP)